MNKLKFKTNVRCDNCVAKIAPFLKENTKILRWEVDLGDPDRTLTVEGENVQPNDVKTALANAGYSAEVKKN